MPQSNPLARRRRRATVLLPLLLWSLLALGVTAQTAAAPPPAIPWSKVAGADDLLRNERETAHKVLVGQRCYYGCNDTIAACLARKPAVPLAWRLARYVVFLAGKGLSEQELTQAMALRRESAVPKQVHRIPTASTPRLGPAEAKVTVVEYADFRCGHCAALGPVLKKLLARHKDQVALYFKPYPLGPGPSVLAARAALAAERQGKFWVMQQLLFDNPEQHTAAGVEQLARQAKLDLTRFRGDLNDKGLLKLIDLFKIEGLRLGIKGTPTLYINGKLFQLRKDSRHLEERLAEELEQVSAK